MGSKERRQRERDEVRAKIMDAARELFAKEGIEAVSMRKIADAVEYSPTIIYQHFADKDALLHELCSEDFGALARSISVEIAKVADPIKRIEQIGLAYARFGIEHPNHYRLMFMTPYHGKRMDAEEMCKKGNPDEDGYAFLKHAVTEAIAAGRLPERADRCGPDLAGALGGRCTGWCRWRSPNVTIPGLNGGRSKQRIRLMLDTLQRGMARDPEKEPQ